ncbi:MAG: MBL fold metallo-hydrolase [Deltaproteobacteria bacterium]|nr:MBL fold metallo-hydrolase [Deltaproteobacteria bacterium]
MKILLSLLIMAGIFSVPRSAAAEKFVTDVLKTNAGNVQITFIGHGTLMLAYGGKIIHIDPWLQLADYSALPQADLILVTHDHPDHLDTKAIAMLTRPGKTTLVLTAACAAQAPGGVIMKNGDVKSLAGLRIEAVPAYNIVQKRPDGQPFHPPGIGNGYVLTFGDKRVYVAGDTENIPAMKDLSAIDVAFLPMNLPYTMTPEMVAAAARSFQPRILYPYHFGETDTRQISDLLKDSGIEVRIRNLK